MFLDESAKCECSQWTRVFGRHSRRFTGFDYDKLRRSAQEAVERLSAAIEGTKKQAEAMAAFVSKHCVGLAREPYHVHRRLPFRE
jgi:hypothetical protein